MRIAVQEPVAQRPVDVEPDEDLAQPVALLLRPPADLAEAMALDELGHQHALAAQLAHCVRDHDERVAPVHARHRVLIGGLELVVELLADPPSDLGRDRARVDPRCDHGQQL